MPAIYLVASRINNEKKLQAFQNNIDILKNIHIY